MTDEAAADRNVRVLVVENDPDDRALIAELLATASRSRYRLTMVDSHDDAVTALESSSFDICLLDYQLDGYTGLDLLASPSGRDFDGPIVMLTGNDSYDIDLAAMQAGAADFLPKSELSATLLERVVRYSINQYQSQKKFTYLARHDQVTGLYNRRVLHERLDAIIEVAQRTGRLFGVLYFDLDGFKSINDNFGHSVGDDALMASARRLKQVCGVQAALARMGGDEFVAVIDGADTDELRELSRRVLEAFREPFVLGAHEISVTASIGIAGYPEAGLDATVLLHNADTAMYAAKRDGRNRFRVFEPTVSADQGTGLANELRMALERDELHLVYQPQFELGSGRIVGLEALARWNHPRLGAISPVQFVPLAERNGCIRSLTYWALDKACRQYCAWLDADVIEADVVMAVNVSSAHADDDDFLTEIKRLLRDVGMPANNLELEFAETTLVLNCDRPSALIDQLRQLGVQVVLDDFGCGSSSLNYLAHLPIDSLKIDLSFLRGVIDNPRDRAMARAIIALGASLGFRVVAEGVENDDQRDFLVDNHCAFGQGFYYAPGLAVADCTRLLKTWAGPQNTAGNVSEPSRQSVHALQ